MKSFLKAGFALLALQSLAFGAGGLLVNKAKTDWTPQENGKVSMTQITVENNEKRNAISFNPTGNKDGENYIMDVVLPPDGLGYGENQKFTFAFHNPKKVDSEDKVGYLEVIVDLSSAKSILASTTKKDEKITKNMADSEVTSPEVYGQYKDNGIGFYMYSQKHTSNEYQQGTNFGKCKNEIKNGKLDSTAKQFKIVIPDNLCTKQGNKETCKDNNYATLVFATDTFYRDCKTNANTNDSKSNFFGIRLSVKHSTEKYSGSSLVLNNMSYNAGASSDAKSTYNLPTLIIGREDVMPELCTPGMKEANEKARKAGRAEPYECNFHSQCVKVSCPGNTGTCWSCTGGTKKKQLLWAACGESDIKDEMDCRKTGAECKNRIQPQETLMISTADSSWLFKNRRNNRDDERLTTYVYPKNSPYPQDFNDPITNTFGLYKCDQDRVIGGDASNWASHFQCFNEITWAGNGVYRSTDRNTFNRYGWGSPGDYIQWKYAEPRKLFVFDNTSFDFEGKCWKDFVLNSTIYSGGYLFRREQAVQGNVGGYDLSRIDDCNFYNIRGYSAQFYDDRTYKYHVKAPKIFTISLRDFEKKSNLRILDKNKVSNLVKSNGARTLAEKVFEEADYKEADHKNLPAFEAKFRIVNAGTASEAPKKYYFKKDMNCWILSDKGVRTDKKLGNSIERGGKGKGRVNVSIDGSEDEPTFTIKSKDFSSDLKGLRIQCQLDFSDYTNVKDHGSKYRNQPFKYAGLYKNFAYNIQLASLKILNTTGAHYNDLALSTRCDFATYWDAFPGNVFERSPIFYNQNDRFEGGKYIARKPFLGHESKRPEGDAGAGDAAQGPNISSKTRHFRFDARPLFYAANPVNDNDKLYAGYKYPEDKTKERALNPEEDLKYLSDKTANDKLIENRAIFFPKSYSGNVSALDIDAKDAEGKPIKGFTSSLTGVIASIYARDDELEFKQLPSIYSTNNKNNTGTTQKLYNQIENCFNDNICQAVWADLKPKPNPPATFTANAFVYSDIVNGDKYLAYNNYGKTLLRLGDSEQTTFSQNNKTTHSDDPEPLCDVGEAKSTCDAGDPNCQKFRANGGLYGCDTIVVNNSKAHNLQNMPADFERKGFKFYTFNPAMMKINTTLSNKSASNSPYNSEKFTYHRAPCSSYPDSTNCNDELENATFTIQVGAAGANKANILANNFLSRYDGQAKAPNDPAEDNIEFRSGLVTPVVVHPDNRNVNNHISTNEFRFKITSEQFKTMSLLLAPRCDTMKLGYSGLKEICRNGNTIDENNYIAKAVGAQLVTATKKMHNQQNTQGTQYLEQTHYQNLLAGASKNGVLDVTIFKTGFTKGVADLKNIDRTTNPKKDLGLLFGQKASEYSLKEKEPVPIKTEAKKVEVPDKNQEPKNKWLEDNNISAMVDATGGAAILDVVLVAPNKQVGGKTGDLKDNAVFLAAYTSNPLMAKELQDAKIIGDIIPGYANYYRIRRDAFPALNAKLFEYSVDGADIGANNITAIGQNEQSQKQSGDFLKVPAGKSVFVKLLGDDAQMYCNFIRNCYPLPNGAGYGAIFTSFESKSTDWKGGSTIIDEAVNKAKTRPTQRRIAWSDCNFCLSF